ncbi:hypothetical protein FQN54_005067 [Arachnomyces sp. PD_36]|nr:hypothetical protein FQN54_005067 [Arachnomyces sp. PD_36]
MKWTSITLGLLPALAAAKIGPEQAGYHVIYSYPGPEPPQELYDLITEGKVGGIVLFEENIHEGTAEIINKTQEAYIQSDWYYLDPLLILTQQEGGELSTLPGGPDMTAKKVGESTTPQKAVEEMAHQTEKSFRPYGVNTNNGPSMGVYREEGDFLDQDERSFSSDQNITAFCARWYFTTMFVDAGLAAIGKHFPGLGAATADQNTNDGPVTIDVDYDTLREVDMYPYEYILSQQIGYFLQMIMPSWATYPAIDPDLPAGLSPKVIKDELRDRLKFEKVIISDSIEAGALAEFGDDGERAVMAMKAGVDLILASGKNVTQGAMIVDALMENLDQDLTGPSENRITSLRKLLSGYDGY